MLHEFVKAAQSETSRRTSNGATAADMRLCPMEWRNSSAPDLGDRNPRRPGQSLSCAICLSRSVADAARSPGRPTQRRSSTRSPPAGRSPELGRIEHDRSPPDSEESSLDQAGRITRPCSNRSSQPSRTGCAKHERRSLRSPTSRTHIGARCGAPTRWSGRIERSNAHRHRRDLPQPRCTAPAFILRPAS